MLRLKGHHLVEDLVGFLQECKPEILLVELRTQPLIEHQSLTEVPLCREIVPQPALSPAAREERLEGKRKF